MEDDREFLLKFDSFVNNGHKFCSYPISSLNLSFWNNLVNFCRNTYNSKPCVNQYLHII